MVRVTAGKAGQASGWVAPVGAKFEVQKDGIQPKPSVDKPTGRISHMDNQGKKKYNELKHKKNIDPFHHNTEFVKTRIVCSGPKQEIVQRGAFDKPEATCDGILPIGEERTTMQQLGGCKRQVDGHNNKTPATHAGLGRDGCDPMRRKRTFQPPPPSSEYAITQPLTADASAKQDKGKRFDPTTSHKSTLDKGTCKIPSWKRQFHGMKSPNSGVNLSSDPNLPIEDPHYSIRVNHKKKGSLIGVMAQTTPRGSGKQTPPAPWNKDNSAYDRWGQTDNYQYGKRLQKHNKDQWWIGKTDEPVPFAGKARPAADWANCKTDIQNPPAERSHQEKNQKATRQVPNNLLLSGEVKPGDAPRSGVKIFDRAHSSVGLSLTQWN